MGKVALWLPAGTVTLAGTRAACGWLVRRFTTNPPDGAGRSIVTVPVEAWPPTTVAGLMTRDEVAMAPGGVTVRMVSGPTPFTKQIMSTATLLDTGAVVIGNSQLTAPAGTVKLAGTLTGIGTFGAKKPRFLL